MIVAHRPGWRLGFIPAVLLAALSIVCLTDAQTPTPKGEVPAATAPTTLATNEQPEIRPNAEEQAKSLPPFTAEALIVSKTFNPFSNAYTEVQLSAVFQSSNGWWHLRATPSSGPAKGLAFDCLTVEGGIRYYDDFGARDGVMIGATACPIEYPPPGMAYYLPLWLALCPNPKLPLLDAQWMRRFVSAPGCQLELINDPRNEGTFGLKYLSPGQRFVSELSITNNGFCLEFMSYSGPWRPPFDQGFHEFQYDLLEVTNVGGFTFPSRATCKRLGPAVSAKSREDVVAYSIYEIRVLRMDFSEEGFRNGSVRPPSLLARDFRPKDLPPDRSVGYIVTDDQWKSPQDPEIARRAKNMNIRPAEPLANPPFRNPSPTKTFEVQGTIRYESYLSGPNDEAVTKSFKVEVNGCDWLIRTSVPGDCSYDEKGFRKGDLFNLAMYCGNSTGRSSNTYVGLIESDELPDDDGTLINYLWLAYASACYLNREAGESLRPICCLDDRELRREKFTMRSFLARADGDPRLPTSLAYMSDGFYRVNQGGKRMTFKATPPFDRGYTNAVYSVGALTNCGALELPLEFAFTRFAAPSGDTNDAALQVRTRIVGKATVIAERPSSPILLPQFSGEFYVKDNRPRSANPSVGQLHYRIRDGYWSMQESR